MTVKKKKKIKKVNRITIKEVFVLENNNFLGGSGGKLAASAAIFFIMSCHTITSETGKPNWKISSKEESIQYYNDSILPQILTMVETGDILTRLGTDITSQMISQTNKLDKDFSHCGIVNFENDTIYVYHAMGGEWNPDQKMKREPLADFVHPSQAKRIGIFRPLLDNEKIDTFIYHIQKNYNAGLLFDMAFDWETDERQYCTEMVAKALIFTIGQEEWLPFSSFQNKKYVSLENIYTNTFVFEKKRINYNKEKK